MCYTSGFLKTWQGIKLKKLTCEAGSCTPCMACYVCIKDHICAITDDMAGIVYGTSTWEKEDVYKHPAFEQTH